MSLIIRPTFIYAEQAIYSTFKFHKPHILRLDLARSNIR